MLMSVQIQMYVISLQPVAIPMDPLHVHVILMMDLSEMETYAHVCACICT